MPQNIVLSDKIIIGDTQKTFIIAEIGQNHQGDLELAKKLIKAAKHSGADCVKFQKTSLHDRFTKSALSRPYESVNSFGKTYGEHRQHLEFTDEEHISLKAFAKSLDILYSASAMDQESLKFLHSLKLPFIKIGSGDANNMPLLEMAASLSIPLIVSTGMQTLDTVQTIYDVISAHHHKFVIMHCVSSYPTLHNDVNLSLIGLYQKLFPEVHIGYSGHEVGSISHMAVAAGAKVIERHFTLDKNMKGSDHACSLDPQEFATMVQEIRHVETLLGKAEKVILPCEMPCRNKLGKSLVARSDLARDTILQKNNIDVKVSHVQGIPAENFKRLIGMQLTRVLSKDDAFAWEYLQDDV